MVDIIELMGFNEIEEEESFPTFLPLPNGKTYHVFLSYRGVESDCRWVQQLIDKLQYKLKCCNHIHDFKPGYNILENIENAITSSVKLS